MDQWSQKYHIEFLTCELSDEKEEMLAGDSSITGDDRLIYNQIAESEFGIYECALLAVFEFRPVQ